MAKILLAGPHQRDGFAAGHDGLINRLAQEGHIIDHLTDQETFERAYQMHLAYTQLPISSQGTLLTAYDLFMYDTGLFFSPQQMSPAAAARLVETTVYDNLALTKRPFFFLTDSPISNHIRKKIPLFNKPYDVQAVVQKAIELLAQPVQ
jgi:hypothetical protein